MISKGLESGFKRLRAFLAYNTDIDAVVRVSKRLEKFFSNDYRKAKNLQPNLISNKADLLAGILRCMESGIGDELEFSDYRFGYRLIKELGADELRMGGQAGIMSNLLATFGSEVIIFTKPLSREQALLFREGVLVPSPGNGLKLLPPEEAAHDRIRKVNWIFEFKRGDKLFDVTATGTTRFIVASRPPVNPLDHSEIEEYLPEIAERIDFAILSGYHDLKERYEDGTSWRKWLKKGKKLIKVMKETNPEILIQIEMGTTHKRVINRGILKEIVPLADSLSMDLHELSIVSGELGFEEPDRRKPEEVYRAMKEVQDKTGVPCLKLHTPHYFLTLSNNYLDRRILRKALLFARDVVSTKAIKGEIKSFKDLEISKRIRPSWRGYRVVKALQKISEGIYIIVPNKYVKKPKSTVGLGDAVSSSTFAVENILRLGYDREP